MLEGAIQLIESGWYQGEIADSAFAFERKVNDGRRVVVGVNGDASVRRLKGPGRPAAFSVETAGRWA